MDLQQIRPPLAEPPQTQNNHKFIWVLVSVFVLLLISAVCVWYFQIREQKQMVNEVKNEVWDVTAGWKTYRDEEYGFELLFNDDWRGYNVEKKDGAIHFLFPTTYSSQKILLFTIGTTTKSDWEEYLKCDCPRPDYLAEKNGVVFITTRHQDPPPDLTNQYTEINKVLSTFKFIFASTSSDISTSDISTWKTYRNEEYGFEFKYPESGNIDAGDSRTYLRILSRGMHFSDGEFDIEVFPLVKKDCSKAVYNPVKMLKGPGVLYIGSPYEKSLELLGYVTALCSEKNGENIQINVGEHAPNRIYADKIFSTFKYIDSQLSQNTLDHEEFIMCLNKKATLYGTYWSQNTQEQKKVFGTGESLINYVECSGGSGEIRISECENKNIRAYPTWMYSDGRSEWGKVSLDELSIKTGCELTD